MQYSKLSSKFVHFRYWLRKAVYGYDRLLSHGEALYAKGKIDDAITLLESLLIKYPEPKGLIRLAQLRHAGFFKKQFRPAITMWPHFIESSPYPVNQIPEVHARELTAETLKLGILKHGALIVRGLLKKQQSEQMVCAINNAFSSYARCNNGGEPDEWYSPLIFCAENGDVNIARKWVRKGGGVLAADSPMALAQLIQTIKGTPAWGAIADYLGETPALSAKKTTLRRVSPDSSSGWHQDGAFLGEKIRTVNLWIALSDCGTDAPSMDMIPRRLDSVIVTGGGDASYSWSLDDAAVAAATGDVAPVRLQFKAGDAILFDELNLHRTAVDQLMTRDRYAIEAWFFAPSTYPLNQIPVLC